MGEKEKVISLYNYISEISKNSKNVIKNLDKEIWNYYLKDLPNDENIEYNHSYDENIIKIRKPKYLSPLKIEKEFLDWIEGNWDNHREKVKIKIERVIEKIIKDEEGNDKKISDIETIPEEIKEKLQIQLEKRKIWEEKQKSIEKVIKIFDSLYIRYLELKKESETIEIVLANGIIKIEKSDIYYPILIKKIKIDFQSKENIITIKNMDEEYISELYTDFLIDETDIRLDAVLELDKKVKEENIYPLDEEKIDGFFKEFIHKLSVNGYYKEELDNLHLISKDSIIIENNPVLIIRKKDVGISKAIDEIIKNIEEFNDIPEQLTELVGIVNEKKKENLESKSEIKKEEILFVKESNKEQMEIAEKIEKHNAVIVQGPPGTGKTHTIANLLGHFLAQGKNVLVTSQTRKALKVLKDKIPEEMRGLCISILDDDNSDMKRSVDSISEKMGSYTSDELKKQVEILEKERIEKYKELKKIKDKLFAIRFRENQSIIYNGESFSVKEVGYYLKENEIKLNKIPGKILDDSSCPINNDELKFLLNYRQKLSKEEEKEIKLGLPSENIFMSKNEFQELILEEMKKTEELKKILDNTEFYFEENKIIVENKEVIDLEKFEKFGLNENLIPNKLKNPKEWKLNIILAGANNGSKRKSWEFLLDEIKNINNLMNDKSIKFLGKNIEYKDLLIKEAKNLLIELEEGIKNPGFIFKRNLKKAQENIGEKILINNKKIDTLEECQLVLEYLDIEEKKEEISIKWNSIATEEIKIENLDEDFFDNPFEYINEIFYYLNWYNNEKTKFVENILNSGLDKNKIFLEEESLLSEEIKAIPGYLERIEKQYKIGEKALEVLKIKEKYDNYKKVMEENLKENSEIEKRIKLAIEEKNIVEYGIQLEILHDLINKKEIYIKEEEILSKIKVKANEWFDSLKLETFNEEIEDIYEVWKWKILSQKIEELVKEPYEKLQKEIKENIKILKKLTLELAINKSWYHVLCFVEKKENLKVSQALRGWKLSMKKIGKGKGKNVELYRTQAKEKIAICQKAVPVWIMPMNKVIDTLNPAKNRFDIVIIDEASQSDISSLVLLYMAKKVIIVGDDKQVSPAGVGKEIDKENILRDKYLKGRISNEDLYGTRSSLYSIASTTYQPLMLREHFRCVPEIISYSNKTSYDYKIKPLREASSSKLKPAVINFRVEGKRDDFKKINRIEAETIVSLIKACLEEEVYKDSSFGVISLLGKEQVDLIQEILVKKLGNEIIEKHNILCGDPSHFQGDERDVIFLSMVDSNEGKEIPLRKTSEGTENYNKKRYNVAASRAKDQMWIVHSLDMINDLKQEDLRRELLEFASNPKTFMLEDSVKEKSDSYFEEEVAKYLLAREYNLQQQWEVGAYKIDMVISCGEKRIALECDGERWHSSEEQIKNDIERQEILERCGWEFIRIRGSKYFRNPERTMLEVIEELNKKGIYPEKNNNDIKIINSNEELLNKIKNRAKEILDSWKENKTLEEEDIDITEEIIENDILIKEPQINIESNKTEIEKEEEKLIESKKEKKIEKVDKTVEQMNLLYWIKSKEVLEEEIVETEDIFEFLKKEELEFIDNRKLSKLLWIIYDSKKEGKLETFLQKMGYQYSLDKRGAKVTKNRKAWRIKLEE